MKLVINGNVVDLSEGAVYTAGDGIIINDNRISVQTPVKPMSKEEYGALSEEEKMAETLYVVPGGIGSIGGSSYQQYTEEEQVVGTWIDGRTIYRRCYTFDHPLVNGTSSTTFDNDFSYEIFSFGGFAYGEDNWVDLCQYRIPYYQRNASQDFGLSVLRFNNTLLFTTFWNGVATIHVAAIVEYFKEAAS